LTQDISPLKTSSAPIFPLLLPSTKLSPPILLLPQLFLLLRKILQSFFHRHHLFLPPSTVDDANLIPRHARLSATASWKTPNNFLPPSVLRCGLSSIASQGARADSKPIARNSFSRVARSQISGTTGNSDGPHTRQQFPPAHFGRICSRSQVSSHINGYSITSPPRPPNRALAPLRRTTSKKSSSFPATISPYLFFP